MPESVSRLQACSHGRKKWTRQTPDYKIWHWRDTRRRVPNLWALTTQRPPPFFMVNYCRA
jgi:mannosyltransferase OCH1-like enzyme